MNQQKLITQSRKQSGFSLVELIVTVSVIGIMAAAAAPGIINWLPNHRLKSAARDLYSTLQQARLAAVRTNTSTTVIFNTAVNPGNYGFNNLSMDLASYGNGIDFGFPAGLVDWNGTAVANAVSYAGNLCTYNSNGTTGSGTVYMMNRQQHIVYAITTRNSGAVKLRKYNGILPYNQNNWID